MSIPSDFTVLVKAYADDLYRYARWLCRDSHQAEDLVQETFLRSWRGFSGLRSAGSAKAWLITTLRREYFRGRRPEVEVSLDDPDQISSEGDWAHDVPRLDNALDAARSLDRLPVQYREVLLLQLHFGYSTGEIAELLGITEPAVANRLLRGRRALASGSMNRGSNVTPIRRNAQ